MAMMDWDVRRAAMGQNAVNMIMCDDDPVFLNALRENVLRVFERLNMQVAVTCFHSPLEVTEQQFASCDMAFLDIDFEDEDCNGIDIARRLRQFNDRALVFFVTNFIDYAPAGYEVRAFRYILKRDMQQVLERYLLQALDQFAQGQELLRLQSKDQFLEIPLQQIRYLEVMDHSVSIHTGSRGISITATLSSLEAGLDGRGFLRIHKSYLVNMRHIRRFRSRECLLTNGRALAVSEKNYSQQKEKYLRWKGLQ